MSGPATFSEMPEEALTDTDVQNALGNLEDYDLDCNIVRVRNYKTIQSALDRDELLSREDLKRLLSVCAHDIPIMKYSTTAVNMMSVILSKLKAGSYYPPPDLVPAALSVINLLKTIALLGKVDSLMTLCLDTLSTYPEETLLSLTEQNYEEVIETVNVCCHTRIATHIKLQVCSLLHKLLKILPREKKKQFVELGVSVWFSKIIPTVMAHMTASNSGNNIQILELLTEDLVHVDYTCNSPWYNILECICNSKQYPATMTNLLHAGSDAWCRLWIVFIRLLKHQITQSLSSVGTPINSMLPVVEAAFKLDKDNRCKAFECWNVLIDSFSSESNESNMNKGLKLLIIPLKSNNAKHLETSLAKFKCWWHLIRKFQNKMDKFLDTVLVSFLQFCFGRYNAVDKSILVPGQISANLKRHCNEAIVDMVGHVNCDGCTELPKLKGKIINTKHLVDNWNHWIYSLTSVIMRTAKNDSGLTKQQIKCLWKSFLKTIGELPENNIRKDLFAEILSIVSRLVQECKSNTQFLDITFNILILSLFEEDTNIKELFKSDDNANDPINRIVNIILDPSLNGFYNSLQPKDLVAKFKTITNLMLDEEVCKPKSMIAWLLHELTLNDYSLLLWAALAKSTYECKNDHCLPMASDVMLWPLKQINSFTKVQIPAMTWYTTYDLMYPIQNKAEVDKEITKLLISSTGLSPCAVYFKLCIVLAVLKHKFTEAQLSSSACEEEINSLLNFTKNINNYDFFEPIMPMLVDRMVAILSIVTTKTNETVTALILICVKNVLHVLTQACKQKSDSETVVTHILLLVANLLKPLEMLFAVDSYSKLIPAMTYHLLRCSPLLSQYSSTRNVILSIMKLLLVKTKSTDTNHVKIKNVINDIEKRKVGVTDTSIDLTTDSNTFNVPVTNEVPKRTSKKETKIVDTVVENGEEYVVVKSNWKFNPRKLTENQKEKLQRKREDIPALYQDLSQSQDEFKLVSWKSDAQDTNSSSKSESKSCNAINNETAEEILKNTPSTNVVPKILETIFLENDKLVVENIKKIDVTTPTNKNLKSPRMALKDRVFRNVRNLIEGSSVQKENKESTQECKPDDVNKTPPSTKSTISSNVNSAPPLLSADRPSRVKRKPKKFEDLELLTSKKSRSSLPDVQSGQSNDRVSLLENDQNIKENNTSESDLTHAKIPEPKIALKEISNSEEKAVHACKSTEMDTSKSDLGVDPDCKIGEGSNVPDTVKTPDLLDNSIQKPLNDMGEISTTIAQKGDDRMMTTDSKDISSQDDPVDVNVLTNAKGVQSVPDIQTAMSANVNNIKSVPDAQVSKAATPKIGKYGKDISTSSATDEIKEGDTISATLHAKLDIEALKTAKDGKENEVACNEVKEESASSTKGIVKETKLHVSTTDSKEISTPRSNRISKGKATGDVIKEDKVLLTPKHSNEIKDVTTPKQSPKTDEQKSTAKKSTVKKSRIEKELAIDTVEGHPLLKIQPGKRMTRKALETANSGRRTSLADRLNKSKFGGVIPKSERKSKEKNKEPENSSSASVVVDESQERDSEKTDHSSFSDELLNSEDIIESSQDSSITSISVKSTRKTPRKVPVICVEKLTNSTNNKEDANNSQSILERVTVDVNKSSFNNCENKDDSVLPLNKTVVEENIVCDLTEDMDTEPYAEKDVSEDVILVNNHSPIVTIASEDTLISTESQQFAEADTQPTDPKEVMDIAYEAQMEKEAEKNVPGMCSEQDISQLSAQVPQQSMDCNTENTANNTTLTLSESAFVDKEHASGASSPFKDEIQRQQDFLNNTIEISPIKTMSPDRDKKSPSPETSSDYVVIKLTSPVHCNGEPFEKGNSPEVFTEDKVSPDKRDQSPPREEINVTNTSPSSSLSLKKNRPQVRSGGRAAQMLGLCVPEKVQAIVNPERNDSEENKKSSTNTPVRRNLRILYNTVGENTDSSSSNGTSDNDDSENFLKFRRSLPTVDCSPSGPILKRKLVEITDEATISPASKRKRVSFHDPPVSTTISVQKYIEPGIIRSPQNSALKKLERQLRQHTPQKSPKRLENAFKLDSVLTKTVESFTENEVTSIADDSQGLSLDETPVAEVVKTSELNNTDPICPGLVGCRDPIENIASELSSPAMKDLFVKELEGTIETIGDLAKLTELEVNRLCIKAPKVTVARKVLTDYASKQTDKTIEFAFEESMTEANLKSSNIEMQTDRIECLDVNMQTEQVRMRAFCSQTDSVLQAHCSVQTDESGSRTTVDIIKSCLAGKPDFVEQLSVHLEDSSIRMLSDKLQLNTVTDLLIKKTTPSHTKVVLDRILEHNSSNDQNKQLSFIRDYLCDKFDTQNLILFCSQLLKQVYDKPS